MEEEQEEPNEDCHKGKDANESENADTDANADPNANDKEKDNQQEKKPKRNPRKGQLVRYTAKDYEGYQTQSHNPHHRSSRGGGGGGSRNDIHTNALERKDLVEFTLVQCNRSKFLYARNISLIQSERDRLEEERERVLLENATLEQGVVVSLKNGFGFLRVIVGGSKCIFILGIFYFQMMMMMMMMRRRRMRTRKRMMELVATVAIEESDRTIIPCRKDRIWNFLWFTKVTTTAVIEIVTGEVRKG